MEGKLGSSQGQVKVKSKVSDGEIEKQERNQMAGKGRAGFKTKK